MSKKAKKVNTVQPVQVNQPSESINLTIRFKQSDTCLTIEVTDVVTELTKQKVYGTALRELFEAVTLQSKTGARIFKLNQPVMISVKVNNIAVDTASANIQLQNKLKLNKTAKSMRMFAQRFVAIADHITRVRKIVDITEVLASLD